MRLQKTEMAVARAAEQGAELVAQNTHAVRKKLNMAVSRPELVHARNVRFVTIPANAIARKTGRRLSNAGRNRMLMSMPAATARDPREKISEMTLAESGGAIPNRRQVQSRITIQRKLVYPSTGRNGGPFQTYP
jgi:hypothetical protein